MVQLRQRQQPQRQQPQVVVAGPGGASHAVACCALHRRPVGHAQSAEAAAPGHFGAPAVVGQHIGHGVQRVQVGRLLVAAGLQAERALPHQQQPPAQCGLCQVVAVSRRAQLRQRPAHVQQHAVVRQALPGLLGGAGVELGGIGLVAGLLEVLGCLAQEVAGTQAALVGQPGQPLRHPGVAFALVALEHGVVGHLVQHLMAEGVLAQAVELRIRPGQRQFALHHRGQLFGGLGFHGRQGLVPEHRAHHAGLLQRAFLGRRQAVQPGLQHAGQRGRHLGHHQAFGVDLPRLTGFDGALVDQHLQQLFHVEGVAFGAAGEQFAQRGGDLG